MASVEAEVARMIGEGCPNVAEPRVKNCTFPERKGIIRTPEEIAKIIDPVSGQPQQDKVVLFSVTNMDWGS